ncbi:hypothetical protein Emag_000977 [Eimeria magna]
MMKSLQFLTCAVAGVTAGESHLVSPAVSLSVPAFIGNGNPSSTLFTYGQSTSLNVGKHEPKKALSALLVKKEDKTPPSVLGMARNLSEPSLRSPTFIPRGVVIDRHERLAALSNSTAKPGENSDARGVPKPEGDLFGFDGEGAGGLVPGGIRGNLRSRRENVSPVVAQMLYEDMLLGRYVEDACARLYYRGKTAGFVHLYTGQEAVSTGVLKLLRKDDAVASTYRDHVHATSKGIPARQVFAELFGKSTGCSRGFGGSMHMFSKEWNLYGGFAFIGEQIPVALGVAFSQLYRRLAKRELPGEKDQVTVCFMGDGTTNMGQFYEAMNMAALMKLPIIFVVENNNWAIGMAAQRSTAVPEIHQRGPPFGVPSIEVDGMDVLAVRAAARQAIERARSGEGPSLIEALTYRFRGHSLADPDELRCPHEKAAFAVRDPVKHFEQYMVEMGYANEETLELTRNTMKEIVEDAVRFAEESSGPDVASAGESTFAPPYQAGGFDVLTDEQLAAYACALKAELDREERKAKGDRSASPPVEDDPNPLTVID